MFIYKDTGRVRPQHSNFFCSLSSDVLTDKEIFMTEHFYPHFVSYLNICVFFHCFEALVVQDWQQLLVVF